MKKILLVFGTRPEAIKMAPLERELRRCGSYFEYRVCVTAQHRQMLDQVLELFGIVPYYDLNIMKQGQDLYDVTSGVLTAMKDVLKDFEPDIVLVHGDTTTSVAASLASFYNKTDVAHVEAGLRTDSIYSPWPEEMNRRLTSRISKFHFAPTQLNKNNLIKENINPDTVEVTGNTVIDALFLMLDRIKSDDELKQDILKSLPSGLDCENDKIILVTGHRRENFGQGFFNICDALKRIAEDNQDVKIVYPVHMNPNVKGPVQKRLSGISNILLIEPLDYAVFVYLMSKSLMILTDSGGIQEEAPSLGKPVLVMRDTTERQEAVDAGTVRLVGTDTDRIVKETEKLLKSEDEYIKMAGAGNPFGDGSASRKIIEYLKEHL